MSPITAHDQAIKKHALECASRIPMKGDVRKVLDNAQLFEAWLKNDTTEVAVLLRNRFE